MDILSSMANLAGYKATINAFYRIGRLSRSSVTAGGTIAAAKVFVIGCGVAGLSAVATAHALGATVLVLPHASLVTNAGLRDNLAALLPLFEEVGASERLIVDHVHQGILAPESGAVAPSTLPMDLLLSHLAAIYVALVWSVARRFGPHLLAPPPARSSQVRDLRVLAALHQRGGHVSAAAARLLTDLSTLSRGRARPLLTEAGVDLAPTTDAGLLALTQAVAALQRDKRL
jgi:hypothetical protein